MVNTLRQLLVLPLLFSIVLLGFSASEVYAQCDRIIYVAPGGSTVGAGTSRTAPVSFERGINILNANNADVMRVRTGTYSFASPATIPILTADNVVIEGGFDANWNKSSQNSDNSIVNVVGGTVNIGSFAYRIGLRANGAQDVRIKDMRFDVNDFGGSNNTARRNNRGNTIKGMHIYGNSSIDISRTTIRAGVGGYAGRGADGPGGSGSGIYTAPSDNENPYSNTWNGGSAIPSDGYGVTYVPSGQTAGIGGWGGGGVFGAYVSASTVRFYDSRTNVGDAGVGGEIPGGGLTSNRPHGSPGDQRWTFHRGTGATRWRPNGSTAGPVTVNNCTRPTPAGACNNGVSSFPNANGFQYPCYTMRSTAAPCAAAIETVDGGEVAQLPGLRNVTVYLSNPPLYPTNFEIERICTNSEVQISKSGGSNNWNLPGTANFVNDVDAGNSSYNTVSDDALIYYTATGHPDLGVTGTSLPFFVTVDQTRALPNIVGLSNGDNLCPNAEFKVSSDQTGVEYDWKIATTAAPTTYVYDYVGPNNEQVISLPATGNYLVRLKVRTTCCGWSRPVYINVESGSVPANTTTWTGAVDDDWFDRRNWTNSVPSCACNTVIPNVTTQPVIETGRVGGTNNIEINLSADLTFQNTAELDVCGNWIDNGSIVPNNGRVSFIGTSGNQTLSKGTGREVFYRLRVDNTDGLTLNSSAEATQQLQMDEGVITTGGNFMYLSNPNAASLVVTPANNRHIFGEFVREITASTAPTWVYPMGTGTVLEQANYANSGGLVNYDHVGMRFNSYGAAPTIDVPEPTEPGMFYNCADLSGYWEVNPYNGGPTGVVCGGYTADYTLTLFPSANNCPAGYQYWTVLTRDNNCSGSAFQALAPGTYTTQPDPTTGIGRRMNSFSDKAVGGADVILPFGLLDFTGRYNKGVSELRWNAAADNSAKGYTLQRSLDAVEFEDVAFVPVSAGNKQNFAYDDFYETDASKLYYRLNVESQDGAFGRSNVLALSVPNGETAFSLYPNPASTVLNLDYRVETTEDLLIEVIALDGRVVHTQTNALNSSDGQTHVDIRNLVPGAYFLKLSQNNKQLERFKFIRESN